MTVLTSGGLSRPRYDSVPREGREAYTRVCTREAYPGRQEEASFINISLKKREERRPLF